MNQSFLDCGAGKSEICKAHFSLATDDPAPHDTGDIFFLEGTSVLLLQPFNWLDETQPESQGSSSSLKVYWAVNQMILWWYAQQMDMWINCDS